MYRLEEKDKWVWKKSYRHVGRIPESLKMYTESDYGGCFHLISLTFLQGENVVPGWLRELTAFKCQRANDFDVLTCFNLLMRAGEKSWSRKLQIVERATDKRPFFFFYHCGSFQEEETQQTLQVKPLLSAFDDSNCIMRLSWSMAEFSTWKITGLAWARQNNAMFEVFVVVHLFFLFKY